MEIMIKTAILTNIMPVLNTYAPGRNYEFSEIKDRRGAANNYIRNQAGNLIKWWRTDNNGPSTHSNDNEKYTGKWTLENKQTNTNGVRLADTCERNGYVWCIAFAIQGNGNKDKLAARFSHNGQICNQIYFCAIREKYRNWVTEISNSNIANHRQFTQLWKITNVAIAVNLTPEYHITWATRGNAVRSSPRMTLRILKTRPPKQT